MFAVIDLETTGLNAASHHRIVEIGVVMLDADLRPVYEWQTLVNPQRDLGATNIHGISAAMVTDAPQFAEIAGDLQSILEGATVVAHNIRFDVGFLRAEFSAACCEWPDVDGLCTMALAHDAGLPRSLAGACLALGISHHGAHSALGDARATSLVLAHVGDAYRSGKLPGDWPTHSHSLNRSGRIHTRDDAPQVPANDYLATLLRVLPPSTAANPGATDDSKLAYKGLLDRALEDRILEDFEAIDLAGVATLWGLTAEDVTAAHQEYLIELAAAALIDGIVTDDERDDLTRVAVLLGGLPSDVDAALGEVRLRPLARRRVPVDLTEQTVCFTGASLCVYDGRSLGRVEAEQLASERGLVPKPSVTKKLDILVVANPDTQSTKAAKARANGTRVIAERQFWNLIGVDVS